MRGPARLKRWIPSDESIGSAAVSMLVAAMAWRSLSSPSFWGALAAGRSLLSDGIPTTDRLTFTSAGEPWLDAQWLYHAAMSALWSWGGATLIVLFKTVAVLSAVFISMRTARRVASPAAAAAAVLLIIPAAAGLMDISSLLVLLPLVSGFIATALQPPSLKRDAAVWIPAQILWINLHPSGFLGPFLAAASAAASWMDFRAGRLRGVKRSDLRARWSMPLVLLAACAINPYGIRLLPFAIRHAAEFFSYDTSLPLLMMMWDPPPVRMWVTFILIVCATGVVLPRLGPPAQALAAAIVGLALLTRSGAALPLMLALGVPFMAVSLDEIAAWVWRTIRRLRRGWPERPPWLVIPLLICVACGVSLGAAADYTRRLGSLSRFGAGAESAHLPSGLAASLQRVSARPRRILLAPADGAYLSWALPDMPVFTDLRSGAQPAEFRKLMRAFAAGDESAFAAILPRWDIDAILLNMLSLDPGPVLRNLKRDSRWQLAYFDGVSALYLPRDAPLPAADAMDLRTAGIERLNQESAALESAISSGSASPAAPRTIGSAHFFLAAGHPAEAAAAFDLLRRAHPSMSRAAFHLGTALLLANRPKEAAGVFHDYTERNPRDAAGWGGRADALRMAGLTNEAAQAGRRAAELLERAKR